MLISPPFLPPRGAQNDDNWIDAAMFGDMPGAGSFPVSYRLEWHGGLHLTAPVGANGAALPARAIADGTVVYLRKRTLGVDLPDAPLNYGSGYTSDAVVVIRHDTEIGANAQGQATLVTFFSVYMHLHSIQPTVRLGRPIYRKDEIGQVGHIYGVPNRMHFEICCDDANLALLVGRPSGPLATTANGRIDAVFGEMYFHLPVGTTVYPSKPLPQFTQAMTQPPKPAGQAAAPAPQALAAAYTSVSELIVGLRYAEGDGLANQRGHAFVTTYGLDGTIEGAPLPEADAEYLLYESAKKISDSYPADARPAMSAVYELLRFGRVIGPDALAPADVAHWREVRYPGGRGWVNLNAQNVHKFSDADFPHWKGWTPINDDIDNTDSACDSATIKGWLDVDQNGTTERSEVQTRLNSQATRDRLKRTICKFPSEWEAATIDQRWTWLQARTDKNPEPLSAEDFAELKAHLNALCFPCPPLFAAQWCFDPREFIRHFRKCGWLSSEEMARVYPDTKYPIRALAAEGRGRTPSSIRDMYRFEINMTARKYLISERVRLTHFFGQGAVESMFLALMVEGSAAYSRNPTHASFQPETNGFYVPTRPTDYLYYLEGRLGNIDAGDGPKFRGRGMKQLTGRENYSKYWVYRGWLNAGTFQAPWWNPSRPNRAPIILDPEQLSLNAHNAIDAGGWYWDAGASSNNFQSINSIITNRTIDRQSVRSVARAINGLNRQTGDPNGLTERLAETLDVAKILMDEL